jgi:hypothetical protein
MNAQYQIHALGDNNFFLQNHGLSVAADEGIATVYINANYEGLFDGLPVSQGFIEHSSSGEATEAMQNMRNLVFEAGTVMDVDLAQADASIWKVFPNPASDVVFIATDAAEVQQWELMNLTGQTVKMGTVQGRAAFDVQSVPQGSYLLRLLKKDAQTSEVQRLIIR